jgi:phenylalanyl-tRNA synthetase beta chain
MPVVNFALKRMNTFFPGLTVEQVTTSLPYIGVDIEGLDNETVRIEYNPNRPDFSSEYGIARALRGILEIETGIPNYVLYNTNKYSIITDTSVAQVRPHILSLVAIGEDRGEGNTNLRQIIAMQEDLHNGLGRHRINASIGIHDLDRIKFPLTYTTTNDNFSFIPLDEDVRCTIKEIINNTQNGREYGYILKNLGKYPILKDADSNVLSFPPVINGSFSKVITTTINLLIEVTAKSRKIAEDILAILAAALSDANYKIHIVQVKGNEEVINSPNMNSFRIDLDRNYVNKMLGLDLTIKEITKCLKRSRLDVAPIDDKSISCIVPRYRIDISQPIDIVEEVAIGYGVYNLRPTLPPSKSVGHRDRTSAEFDVIRETMIGMGLLEVMNSNLVSRRVQYELMGINEPEKPLAVEASKSTEHEILRVSLIPSLMRSLGHNIHEGYPQRLFELGKIFRLTNKIVNESWFLGAVIAHNAADYTEAKSIVQTCLKIGFGKDSITKPARNPIYTDGRSADIIIDKQAIGVVGEITPIVLDNFRIRVPVASFDLNLSQLLLL